MSRHDSRSPTDRETEARETARGFEIHTPGNDFAWLASDTTVPLDEVE